MNWCAITLVNLCLLVAFIFAAEDSKSGKPPHILFIIADDLGYHDVSYNGAEFPTPNIDKLANDGVILKKYYVHNMCTPTRSAFLTGKYSWKLGIPSAFRLGCPAHMPLNLPTMADFLKKSGKYDTHYVGKWHLGYATWDMTPVSRGFDTAYGIYQGETDYYTHELVGFYDFWENRRVDKSVIGDYATDLYINRTKSIISDHLSNNIKKSLYIYLSFQIVHAPIQLPPKTFNECITSIVGEGRRIFCNMVKYMDFAIGEIRDYMKSLKIWKNTVVIFTTDNGGIPNHNNVHEYGTDDIHGISSYACNMPYRGGKRTNFEGGVKAVGFLSGGYIAKNDVLKGTESDLLLHAIDWLPTIIEGFAGITINREKHSIDGQNMMTALLSSSSKDKWKRKNLFIHIENYGMNSSMIYDNKWKYVRGWQQYNSWYHCNGIYPNNKLDLTINSQIDNDSTEEWLFDLENDPNEKYNLIQSEPEIKQIIRGLINDEVYRKGEYVPKQPNELVMDALPIHYCNVWYPWIDWDPNVSCNELFGIQNQEKEKEKKEL